MAKEKDSRKKEKPHGKKERLMAKGKNLTSKEKISRQKKKPHVKRRNLTTKEKTSRQKEKTARQREKVLFFLLWGFFFCRDSCGPPCISYATLTSTQKTPKKLLALCACPCFLSRGRGVVSCHLQIDDRKSCESPSWLEEKILLSK